MNCPECGRSLENGFLTMTAAPPWTLLRWSVERRVWGPRPLPKDSVVVMGPGFGARPRRAARCGDCGTVVFKGD